MKAWFHDLFHSHITLHHPVRNLEIFICGHKMKDVYEVVVTEDGNVIRSYRNLSVSDVQKIVEEFS